MSAENVVRLKQIVAVLAVVLGIAFALIPPPTGLNRQAMIALGIVVWAVFWWITQIIPEYVTALMMCTLWAGTKCVRIIAASNRDLYAMAQEGSFRRDLFFRLNILPLQIPPLRKRKEDISALIAHFIKKSHQGVPGHSRIAFNNDMLATLNAHNWPGNVRELEHILERAFTLYDGQQDFAALLTDLMRRHCLRQTMAGPTDHQDDYLRVPRGTMAEMERYILETSLDDFDGNKKALADALGISRVTVWKKLKELEGQPQE